MHGWQGSPSRYVGVAAEGQLCGRPAFPRCAGSLDRGRALGRCAGDSGTADPIRAGRLHDLALVLFCLRLGRHTLLQENDRTTQAH